MVIPPVVEGSNDEPELIQLPGWHKPQHTLHIHIKAPKEHVQKGDTGSFNRLHPVCAEGRYEGLQLNFRCSTYLSDMLSLAPLISPWIPWWTVLLALA